MPYTIVKSGNRYCVHKKNDDGSAGKRIACHDSRDKAARQMRAIYANEGSKALVEIIKGDDGRRYMLILTSNAYRDRESEILKQSTLQSVVDEKWDGDTFVGDDVLLFFHKKGAEIGNVVFADMIGRFLVEIAREGDDVEIDLGRGKKARVSEVWDFIELTSKSIDWGASHGFKYYPRDREDGVYHRIVRKWETSVLPVQYAANSYTYAGVKRNGKR